MSGTPATMGPVRRVAVGLAASAVSFVALSGLAFGDYADVSYPPGDSRGTVSSGTARPGETVTFAATGFDPAESIAIAQSSGGKTTAYQTVKANADGTTSAPVALNQSGFVTLSATGQLSGHMATSVVSVAGGGGRGSAAPLVTTPYSLAGISSLSLAALALVAGLRLLFLRPMTIGLPRPRVPTARQRAATSGHRRPASTGGKHRKR